jgi:phosphoglycolate phosphatase
MRGNADMIKACVFDLDGTLLDSLRDIANSANYALANNGYPQWDVEQYRSFVGDGVLTLLQRAL